MDHEERLAVFIDYENLALGAREHLGGMSFDFGPIADALAVRGRVVVRRAYADWSYFDEDRRALTRHQVELIEMPQRMGASRKNAADIKMVVDAIEMAFEREYISTFVMCTGDSDFSPLVHKLRELNKRVIGVGVEKSTSRLLPPACDEFLFYDRLEGVDVPDEPTDSRPTRRRTGRRGASSSPRQAPAPAPTSVDDEAARAARAADAARQLGTLGSQTDTPGPKASATPDRAARSDVEDATFSAPADAQDITSGHAEEAGIPDRAEDDEAPSMEVRVAQTLANLQSSTSGAVTASVLKRALLRRDPTFSEAEYGFRSFSEFLRYLADRDIVELTSRPQTGDPEVSLPEQGDSEQAFSLLRAVLADAGGPVPLSGLKNRLRKRQPAFSEKTLGFRGFLQFAKAAQAAGVVSLGWDDAADDYLVAPA